ncbi:MFS transporter [Streptomyces sp. NPDC001840]
MSGFHAILSVPGPARYLFAGTFAYALGRGIYSTAAVVFFAISFGFSVTQIGMALSGAGIAALLVALPTGYLADRWGPRRLATALAVVQTGLMVPFLLADSYGVLLPFVVALGAADRASSIVRKTLVSHVMGEKERVRIQAYLRSTANVAMSIGALVVAPALAVGTRLMFSVLVVVTMGAFLLVALVTTRLPAPSRLLPLSPVPTIDSRTASPARVRKLTAFTALGLLNGLFALHISVLDVALPLWITEHTDAPRWVVSALILVNTGLAVAFQVLLSRGASTVRGAARTLTASSLCTALACVVFAASADRDGVLLLAVLLIATVALTAGELFQSAGEWGLSFGLAPAHAQGKYMGVFSIGTSLQDIFGPIVVVSLAIVHVPGGWFALGAVLLIGGLLVPLLTRAATERPVPAAPELPSQPRARGPVDASEGVS